MSQHEEELVQRLEAISEDLGDRSMSLLREALETGDADAVETEKRVVRARRAVDKAINLLGGGSPGLFD